MKEVLSFKEEIPSLPRVFHYLMIEVVVFVCLLSARLADWRFICGSLFKIVVHLNDLFINKNIK